jgi:hypothetical protein
MFLCSAYRGLRVLDCLRWVAQASTPRGCKAGTRKGPKGMREAVDGQLETVRVLPCSRGGRQVGSREAANESEGHGDVYSGA